MQNNTGQNRWGEYRERELAGLRPILKELGFELAADQPHLGGERHLTRPLGSGRKLVLVGRRDGARVIIKASSEAGGIKEIEHERTCREILERISFAYQTFLSPKELLFVCRGAYTILITEFIEQERPFVERPVEEQFALALKAFKAQESAHATTYAHARIIKNTFGEMRAAGYVKKIKRYTQEAKPHAALGEACNFLSHNMQTLEQYGGFLTHWDFTPQNIRVRGGDIYLLDHSSLHFGNKYEGWARLINFMALYNPPLAGALVQYVRDNRAPEESLALKLMRVYRLAELVRYYVGWLPNTEDNLNELAKARIAFWSEVLRAVLGDQEVPAAVIESYKQKRDSLRSEEEKLRQVGLH
ncbi:MAG: hypothetical protein AAB919_03500 [Patescibacteria group bacterium]